MGPPDQQPTDPYPSKPIDPNCHLEKNYEVRPYIISGPEQLALSRGPMLRISIRNQRFKIVWMGHKQPAVSQIPGWRLAVFLLEMKMRNINDMKMERRG